MSPHDKTYLLFSRENFARLFRPKAAMCHKVLELTIDDIHYISYAIPCITVHNPASLRNITLFNIIVATVRENASTFSPSHSTSRPLLSHIKTAVQLFAQSLKQLEDVDNYIQDQVTMMLTISEDLDNSYTKQTTTQPEYLPSSTNNSSNNNNNNNYTTTNTSTLMPINLNTSTFAEASTMPFTDSMNNSSAPSRSSTFVGDPELTQAPPAEPSAVSPKPAVTMTSPVNTQSTLTQGNSTGMSLLGSVSVDTGNSATPIGRSTGSSATPGYAATSTNTNASSTWPADQANISDNTVMFIRADEGSSRIERIDAMMRSCSLANEIRTLYHQLSGKLIMP